MTTFKLLCIVAAIVVLGFGPISAEATLITVTTADGNGADAFINTGNATLRDTNFGNNTLNTAKLGSTGAYPNQTVSRKGYMRFDISSYQLAPTNAVLNLYTVGWSGTGTMEVWGLNDGDVGENWVEGDGGTGDFPVGEIDWNNAPANDLTAATTNTFNGLRAILLGAFTQGVAVDGTQISFTDPDLNSFLLNDTNGLVTLMLIRTTANDGLNTAWAADEHLTILPPSLQFVVVPEPSSIVLLGGLGVLLVGRRARRRKTSTNEAERH